MGAKRRNAPSPVATPLPPRNFSQTGKMWPTMAKSAAGQPMISGGAGCRSCATDCARELDRQISDGDARSFGGVEQQRQDAERRRFAGDVGGADVAAAGAADVFAAEDADQEIAEGDGAQEIADGGDEEESGQLKLRTCLSARLLSAVHARDALATAGAYAGATLIQTLASFVYFDPFGESWLWYRKNSRAVMVPNSGVGECCQFFLQTLKAAIGASSLRRRGRAGAAGPRASVRCGLKARSSFGIPSADILSSIAAASAASSGPASMPIQKTRADFAVGKNP